MLKINLKNHSYFRYFTLAIPAVILLHISIENIILIQLGGIKYISLLEILFFLTFALPFIIKLLLVKIKNIENKIIDLFFLFSIYLGCKLLIYPFEYDVIEGNLIAQGVGLFQYNVPLYQNPYTTSTIAYMYMPFTSILFGGIFNFFNNDLFYVRLIVFCAVMFSGLMLNKITETIGKESKVDANLPFKMWIIINMMMGGYLFSCRPDSILILFSLLSLQALFYFIYDNSISFICCSVFAALIAFMFKQHGIFLLIPIYIALLIRKKWIYLIIFSTLTFALSILLFLFNPGDGFFTIVTLGSHHKLFFSSLLLLFTIPVLILLIYSDIDIRYLSIKNLKNEYQKYLLISLFSLIPICTLALMKGGIGSYNNLSLIFALLIPLSCNWQARKSRGSILITLFLVFSCLSSFINKQYMPWRVLDYTDAAEINYIIKRAKSENHNILLSRRQLFLLQNGIMPKEDLGAVIAEYPLPEFKIVHDRVLDQIFDIKYGIILMTKFEFDLLFNEEQKIIINNKFKITYLKNKYFDLLLEKQL